jgi:ferritin-like metal-binding protein YciE
MGMDDPRDMLVHELGDMLDAENKLTTALGKMAKKAGNANLKSLFEDHLEETKEQIERLQLVFKSLDEKSKRQPCKGMSGLISEFQDFVKEEKPEPELLDVYAVGAAIKVEHYEISSYESMINMANALGLAEEAETLKENLKEEQSMLKRLQEIGQELIAALPPSQFKDVDDEEEMPAKSAKMQKNDDDAEMNEEESAMMEEEVAPSATKRKGLR